MNLSEQKQVVEARLGERFAIAPVAKIWHIQDSKTVKTRCWSWLSGKSPETRFKWFLFRAEAVCGGEASLGERVGAHPLLPSAEIALRCIALDPSLCLSLSHTQTWVCVLLSLPLSRSR